MTCADSFLRAACRRHCFQLGEVVGGVNVIPITLTPRALPSVQDFPELSNHLHSELNILNI